MAGLLKEVLIDLAQNRIVHHDIQRLVQSGASVSWEYLAGWEQQCETRCDVVSGLQRLLDTRQVDTHDIMLLYAVMIGLPITKPHHKERLIHTLALLEEEIQYTDERYLTSVCSKYPKFNKTKDAYRKLLFDAGRVFDE